MSSDGPPVPPPKDVEVEVASLTDFETPGGPDVGAVVDDVRDVIDAVNNDGEGKKKVRKRKKRRVRSPMPGIDPGTGIAMVGGPPPPPSKPVLDSPDAEDYDLENADPTGDRSDARRGRKFNKDPGHGSSYVKSVAMWPSWGTGRRSKADGKDVRRYSSRKRKSNKGRSTSQTPATRGFSNLFQRSGLRAKDSRGRQAVDSTDVAAPGEAPPPPAKSVIASVDAVSVFKEKKDVIMMPPMKFKNERAHIVKHKVMCFLFCFLMTAGMAGGSAYLTYTSTSTSAFSRGLDLNAPTETPTRFPIDIPSASPTFRPTTPEPTLAPTTPQPTFNPTTSSPTLFPTTSSPTLFPTVSPTFYPTTSSPTLFPTES